MEQTQAPPKPKLPPLPVIRTVGKIREGFTKLNRKLVPPNINLMEIITSQWTAQALSVAASLGVADRMPGDQAYSSDTLAAQVEAHPESLYRLMRALTTAGVFIEEDGRRFRLTAEGKCLMEDHPQSVKFFAIFQGKYNWSNWAALEHSVRTGQCALKHVHGKYFFELLTEQPEAAKTFDRAMTNISAMSITGVLGAYDFSPFKTIADVGGGHGSLLASILKATPQARGIVFDLPHVAEGAKRTFAKAGLEGRAEAQGGSFFEKAPAGADCYLMKHIVHDWSDAESTTIMKHIRSVIPPGGKLLLIETVVSAPNENHFSKWLDLEMLVVTTGKERTEGEYRKLLAGAGFKLERIVPTIGMASVIEASPA